MWHRHMLPTVRRMWNDVGASQPNCCWMKFPLHLLLFVSYYQPFFFYRNSTKMNFDVCVRPIFVLFDFSALYVTLQAIAYHIYAATEKIIQFLLLGGIKSLRRVICVCVCFVGHRRLWFQLFFLSLKCQLRERVNLVGEKHTAEINYLGILNVYQLIQMVAAEEISYWEQPTHSTRTQRGLSKRLTWSDKWFISFYNSILSASFVQNRLFIASSFRLCICRLPIAFNVDQDKM